MENKDLSARIEEMLSMTVEELWRAHASSIWMTHQIERELTRRKRASEDLSAYDGLIR